MIMCILQPPICIQILLGGDLNSHYTDEKGELIVIDQNLSNKCEGIAALAFYHNEILDWTRWLGLTVTSSNALRIQDHFLEIKIGMYVRLVSSFGNMMMFNPF